MHVDYVKWVIFSWFFYFLNYRCIVYLLFIIVYFIFYEKMSIKSIYLQNIHINSIDYHYMAIDMEYPLTFPHDVFYVIYILYSWKLFILCSFFSIYHFFFQSFYDNRIAILWVVRQWLEAGFYWILLRKCLFRWWMF